jgi:hypothetical protein
MLSALTNLRRFGSFALILMLLAAGCQSVQLQQKTTKMASYLSDIQYGQVLDNLALIANNPDALPHYALSQGSKCSVQYADQTNAALNWDRITAAGSLLGLFRLDKENASTTISRLDVTEWDTTPDIDPVQEILMQGLYRKVLGYGMPSYQIAALDSFFFAKPLLDTNKYKVVHDALNKLNNLPEESKTKGKSLMIQMQTALDSYRPEYSQALNQVYQSLGSGWVHVGNKKDIPKEACSIGKCHHTYVWVMPEDFPSLTNLTIAVLDIANADLSVQSGRAARGTGLSKLPPPYTSPAGLATPSK